LETEGLRRNERRVIHGFMTLLDPNPDANPAYWANDGTTKRLFMRDLQSRANPCNA
jgi:hypothetical protein